MPTVEGLFRNSNNKDLEGNLAVMELVMTSASDNSGILGELGDESKEEKKVVKKYLKILFNIEDVSRTPVILATYDGGFNFSQLKEVKYLSNFHKTIAEDKLFKRRLFYSLINMYALNSSKDMNQILKEIAIGYKDNKEAINEEKKALLIKYKDFLERKKKHEEMLKKNKDESQNVTSDEQEEPQSPLSPVEQEEKERISKIMSKSMYSKSENLKLVKRGRRFFWELNLEGISATFDNETHDLRAMSIATSDKNFKVIPQKHVVFGGKFLLPKSLNYNDGEKVLDVEIKNYYTLNSDNKNFISRLEDYQKHIKKNQTKSEPNDSEIIENTPEIDHYLYR